MRNKRLIATIAILLLVVLMLSIALVACKPKEKPEDNPDNGTTGNENQGGGTPPGPPAPPPKVDEPPIQSTSFREAVKYFVGSMSGDYMSLDFTGYATVGGTKYVMSLKGNVSEDDLELAAVFKTEGTDDIAFAMYIVNSRLFVQVANKDEANGEVATIDDTDDGELEGEDPEGAEVVVKEKTYTIYNIAEIDVNYLLSIVDKLPDTISGLLNGISIPGLSLSIPKVVDLVIDLLLSNLSPSDTLVYEDVDGVEKFALTLDVNKMLSPIIGLLSPDSIIGGVLPEGLDLGFVSDLLNMVPKINGDIKATVDHGVLSEFSLELRHNDPAKENYQQVMLGLENVITFGKEKLDLNIPEELEHYQTLTLGNLNFDFTLDLNTGDEPFDIGALIDAIMTSGTINKESIFGGSGILVLDAHATYRLEIKASIDPDLFGSNEDNNLINVVLWIGDHELVRANYMDGKIYLRVLDKGVNGFADGGINVVINLPLKKYISQLVKLLTGYIDGFLGTQFRPETAASAILSASITRSGETILSPSIQDIIVSVLKLLGMEKCIDFGGDDGHLGDRITVLVNDELFAAIGKLAGIEIDLPITAELTIGLFKGGIEFVEISAININKPREDGEDDEDAEPQKPNYLISFKVDNFYIGKAKIDRDYVLDSIDGPESYSSDIGDILINFALNLLSDLDVSIDLDVSTIDTKVNLTSIINSIMAVANSSTYLKFPITLDLSKYDGTFNIRLATNYNENTGDGRVLLEVFTPDDEVLLAAYNENANTYVDLSGLGFMKFCLTNVNIFQLLRGMLGAVEFDEGLLEDEGSAEADVALSSSATIDNDSIGLAVENLLITKILKMLSMDLGLDLGVRADLNFDGSVDIGLDLGLAASLGLKFKLGKESESHDRETLTIQETIENLAGKSDYKEYNALGAEALVDSILDAEELFFTIDIYNQNVDNTSHDNKSRLILRRSTAAPGSYETLGNGLQAPYRSLVVALYEGWNSNPKNAFIYAYLDFNNKKVQLKGTAKLLDVNVLVTHVTGEILDIPIDNVDIRQMLIDALSGIFESSGVSGGSDNVIEVPDGALPPQKPHKCSQVCAICGGCMDADCRGSDCATKCSADKNGKHCTQKCEECGGCKNKNCEDEACSTKCTADSNGQHPVKEPTPPIEEILPGIKVTLTGNMDIDVDVNIDGIFISKMLRDLLKDLFWNLSLPADLTTKTGPVNVNYDNVNSGVFFEDLYKNLLLPIIEKKATGIVSGIASAEGIKNQVKNLVTRFLPLPNVEELNVNVSLTNGKLANITAIGKNNSNYNTDKVNGAYVEDARRTDLGFGIYIFNKKANEEVSWEHQATSIYFNRTFSGDITKMFEENVRVHIQETENEKPNWETDSYYAINWTVLSNKVDDNLNGMSLEEFASKLNIEQGKDGYIDDGEYVFEGKATVTSLNKVAKLEVTLTLDSAKIESIKDMEVPAMRDVPTYVYAVLDRKVPAIDENGKPEKDEDGNVIMVNDEKLITDVNIQLPDGRVTSENNASVVIGGKTYQFTITFEDEVLELDTLELNAYDYVDKLNAIEETGVIRVKVNDTFYRNLPVDVTPNMWKCTTDRSINVKKLSREDAQVRMTYFVNVHVGRGTPYEQDMNLQIEFKPFDIYYIERDVAGVLKPDYSKGEHNELNYIETDYIEDAFGNAFPEEMTVVGFDGEKWLRYTARFDWDIDFVIDLKGGQYFARAIINKGDYNQWVMEGIEVNVLPSDIVGLANSSKETVFDLKYYLYGGVDFEDCIASVLNFRTSSGRVRRDVPVTIDTSKITDEVIAKALAGTGSEIDCPVSIDVKRSGSSRSLFTTTVKVIVPSVKMSLIDNDFITDGEINIDVNDENLMDSDGKFMGLAKYFGARSKMEIKLGDDVVTANVTWSTDDVVVGTNGSYTARVYIDRGGKNPQYCVVKVNIDGNVAAQEEV